MWMRFDHELQHAAGLLDKCKCSVVLSIGTSKCTYPLYRYNVMLFASFNLTQYSRWCPVGCILLR